MPNNHVVSEDCYSLYLPDGRMLGYAIYGAAQGNPLFYMHGYPGSRLEAAGMAAIAAQIGLRIIAIDRPGMGLSSFQPDRRLLDWPKDVVAIADHLSIDRFTVLGVSGGGPYALACASQLPDRVTACGIASGIGPPECGTEGMLPSYRLALFLARWSPWLLAPLLGTARWQYRDESKARAAVMKSARQMGKTDRVALLMPEVSQAVAASTVEAFRQGVKGVVSGATLYARPWGFRLEAIACPRLLLWHGMDDRLVPLTMGRAVAARLPHCQATFYPGDGHFSVLINHFNDVLSALLP